MSHDILSLKVYYSPVVFVKEGKENRNTQYYRITLNINRNTNRMYHEKIKLEQKHMVPAILHTVKMTDCFVLEYSMELI